MLFQDPALFPWLNVRANVEFALQLIGVPKDERPDRAMHWLRRVHLGRFANAQPHELSGGMRSRAAIARALACQPEVLLADEPFAALDAQTREILQAELQEVWSETRNTFVFVTHNVREAVFLADRVVLMSAPPGTFVAEHRITAPRPREFEDVLLSKVVVDIHDHLLKEVEKVVEREREMASRRRTDHPPPRGDRVPPPGLVGYRRDRRLQLERPPLSRGGAAGVLRELRDPGSAA